MTLLILGGTEEARTLAASLADLPGARVSLAGATRKPAAYALPMRLGGFGGEAGFEQYLLEENVSAVLDATHPFATSVSRRSRDVCDRLKLPYLQIMRPAWTPGNRDQWLCVRDYETAVQALAAANCVFLATGRQSLARFVGLRVKQVFARVIDRPAGDFPFVRGEYVTSRPPYSLDDEVALFARLGVDRLVAKNSGGLHGRAKLDAARALGIPVVMVARPPVPCDRVVDSVPAALDWVRRGESP